jgi:hypothetical protein
MKHASLVLPLVLVGLTATSCRNDLVDAEGKPATVQVTCPNRRHFVDFVSELMEKRCGMLDCHGSDYRPMRIFGRFGLRSPVEAKQTGIGDSTDLEKSSNYYAVCAVEPEKMREIHDDPGGNAVNTLLVVRKGRGQEGHKGGKVFEPWDDADRCVVGWLRGDNEQAIRDACKAALAKLP